MQWAWELRIAARRWGDMGRSNVKELTSFHRNGTQNEGKKIIDIKTHTKIRFPKTCVVSIFVRQSGHVIAVGCHVNLSSLPILSFCVWLSFFSHSNWVASSIASLTLSLPSPTVVASLWCSLRISVKPTAFSSSVSRSGLNEASPYFNCAASSIASNECD